MSGTDAARLVSRIGLVTRAWPGQGDEGLRVVNPDAAGVPIYWIFNTADEMPALLPQVPADRPFAGMRSLNQLTSLEDRRATRLPDLLATHYADRLIAQFGRRPCVLGGNCQAADIAWRVAERLLQAGVALRQFLTLDAAWFLPLAAPVRMIFGRQSNLNPALAVRPNLLQRMEHCWSYAFPGHERVEIPGAHGQYFQPQHVGALAGAILRPAPEFAVTGPMTLDWKVRAGRGRVRFYGPDPAPAGGDDCLVLPLRRLPGESLRRQTAIWREATGIYDPASGAGRGPEFRLRPTGPERGDLVPVLCRRGQGPLGWPLAAQPGFALEPHGIAGTEDHG